MFQTFLLSATLFLLPTNLFLKFFEQTAYVNGMLVDYLIPKLYLSDIPLMMVLLLWFFAKNRPKYLTKPALIFGVFALVHLAAHRTSPHLISTAWFLLKLFEMGAFAFWLIEHHTLLKHTLVKSAILGMLLFQSTLAFAQWRAQHTIFGYWFFGEPLLENTALVAKTKYSGALRVLPYATTPHPNVLAGIVTLFGIYVLVSFRSAKARVLGLGLAGVVLALTQSFAGAAALVSASIGAVLERKVLGLGLVLLISIPLVVQVFPSTLPSFVRRAQLQTIALREFAAFPLFGVGLNQFTVRMEQFGFVSATTRYQQPAHQVPALWLSETGLAGIVFLILFAKSVQKMYSVNFPVLFCALLPLIIISSLDHYLFTLQAGQLLTAFYVGILLRKKDEKSYIFSRD